MFDSIDLKEAISDLFDVGVTDDTLALLYEANSEVFMAVKTQNGLTGRQSLRDIVLQGDTWGSLLASNQVDKIGKDCTDAGHGYLYKNKLPIAFLGLVDDIICVTEAGFKAQEMNSFINVKAAEKNLQFGNKKCKSMLIGKNKECVVNSQLMVDSWETKYEQTGDNVNLVETFTGLVNIEKTNEQKYLGFVISNLGNNLANIKQVRNKSIGTIRKLLNRLNGSNLGKYYFESAYILMNSMLRSSILYASETYYNLKENELRQLERIEESYMRQILKTKRSCPITQIYLELGQIPARYQIKKIRLLFLKDILSQNDESMISKFFQLQVEQSTKGDWYSSCISDLNDLKIELSFQEIKLISKHKFSDILNKRINSAALSYLTGKQNIKGGDIIYTRLEISEYLSPLTSELTIDEKRKLFEIRNMMTDIPANYSNSAQNMKCICQEYEDMSHIYYCREWNSVQPSLSYEKIYNGTISEQIKVFRRFENNLEMRKQSRNTSPLDPFCDRLNSYSVEISVG